MTNQDFLSTSTVAKILGISRVAVFKKIKSGKLKAEKIGRNFVITKEDLLEALGQTLSEKRRQEIDEATRKAIQDFGEAFKRLGKE